MTDETTDRKCVWTPMVDDPRSYETGCEQAFQITEGTPEENYFAYCPYCGGELKVLKPTTDGEPT